MNDKFGRYEIAGELGRGGMATVFRARDPEFGRDVAVKVLPRALLHDPTFVERFRREARMIAALEHPAIVPVYDFGEQDGQPYLVMRYMPGGSLAERIPDGPIPIAETASILQRIGSALDWAHSQGVIHRDMKPGNILFDQYGEAYLSDFGIARLAEGGGTLTGSRIIGTPAYMSPEQGRGDHDLDGRTDIYALGAIVFEMLTGQQPYHADTPMGVVVKHITEPTPRARAVNPKLPPASDQVIDKALAKEREARYGSALELATAVGRLVSAAGALQAALPPTAAEAALPGATVVEPPPRATVREAPPAVVSTPPPPPPSFARPAARPRAAPPPRAPARKRRRVPVWAWVFGALALAFVILGLAGGALLAAYVSGWTATPLAGDGDTGFAVTGGAVGETPATGQPTTAVPSVTNAQAPPTSTQPVMLPPTLTATPVVIVAPPTTQAPTVPPPTVPPPTRTPTPTFTATFTFTPTTTPTRTATPTPASTTVVQLTLVTGADGTTNNPTFALYNEGGGLLYSTVLDQPGDLQPSHTDVYTFNVPAAFCDITNWRMSKPSSPGGEDPWVMAESYISVGGKEVWFDRAPSPNPVTGSIPWFGGGWSGTQAYKNECG